MNPVAFARPPSGLYVLAVRELASRAYRLSLPPPPATPWWQRILFRVGDFWNYVVRTVFGHAHAGNAPTFAGGAIALLALAAVSYFAWRLFATIAFDRRNAGTSEPLPEAIPASEWYRRAVANASRGDLVAASRFVLAAAVTALAERGAISPTAGSTVGELRRALDARAPQYASPFARIARVFAIGVYAERPLDAAEVDGAMTAYRAIAGDA